MSKAFSILNRLHYSSFSPFTGLLILFFAIELNAQPVKIYYAGNPSWEPQVRQPYESFFGVGNVNIYKVTEPGGYLLADTTFSDDTVFTQYDIVYINDIADIYFKITPAHANGLVDFIRQGGHVILSLEGNTLQGTSFQVMEYVWNELTGESITQGPGGASGTANPPRFHPSNGPWGLSSTPSLAQSSQSYANFGNVFPENVTHQRNLTPPSCNNIEGVTIVYPSRPKLGDGTLFMTGEYVYPFPNTTNPDLVAHRNALVRMHHTLLTNNQSLLNQLNTWASNLNYVKVNLGKDTMLCSGGGASVLLNAGSTNNTYQWNTGATSNTLNVNTSGMYSVTATSPSGCVSADTISVMVGNVKATYWGQNPSCNGKADGSITITPSLGSVPFEFKLNNGTFQSSGIFNGLPAGSYSLKVRDATLCEIDTNITLVAPVPLNLNVNTQNPTCNNSCNGTAIANANGGSAPYNFVWSSNVGQASGGNASSLCAGSYSVIVNDNKGCSDTALFNLTQPTPVLLQSSVTSLCANGITPLNATANGGTGLKTINWMLGSLQFIGAQQSFNVTQDTTVKAFALDENLCSSDTLDIMLIKKPNPQITVNAAQGCSPLQVQFTLNNANNNHNFNWNFGDNSTSTNLNPNHTFVDANNYYVVLITTSNTSSCADTNSIAVQVNSKPMLSFSADSVCIGSSSNFSANATFSDASFIANWSWNFGDGNSSSLQNPQHAYNSSDLWNVSFSAISNNGCASDTSFIAVVHPNPNVDFTFSNACFDEQPISFQNLTNIQSWHVANWLWDFGDGNSSVFQNPHHNFLNTGLFSIQLTATSNNNCTATATKNIEIFPSSTASFTVQNNCADSAILLVNNSTPSNATFEWNFGNGQTSTLLNPLLVYASSGNYTITQIATSGQCKDTAVNTVVVHPNPIVDFTFSNACFDEQPIAFQNLTNIQNGQVMNWLWDFGDGNSSIFQNPHHNFLNTGLFSIQLTATSNNNCTATATKNIEIFPSSTASFTVQNNCADSAILLVNNSTPSNATFEWNFGNGQTSTLLNPLLVYASSGNYTITQIATSGQCKDTAVNTVVVHPNPIVDFYAEVRDGFNDGTAIIAFDNESKNGDLWFWDFGDGNTSTLFSPTQLFDRVGKHSVSLTATSQFGCSNQLVKSDYITIYESPKVYIPNLFSPNNDGVNDIFLIYGSAIKTIELKVFNRWGIKVFESDDMQIGWDGNFAGEKAEAGVYTYTSLIVFETGKAVRYNGSVTLIR